MTQKFSTYAFRIFRSGAPDIRDRTSSVSNLDCGERRRDGGGRDYRFHQTRVRLFYLLLAS